MARAPRPSSDEPGSVPVVSETDAPAVPATEPLPSDQISTAREPVAPAVVVASADAPVAVEAGETAPLPAPVADAPVQGTLVAGQVVTAEQPVAATVELTEPVAVAETTPLPAPGGAMVDPVPGVGSAASAARFATVDATVPLPSDQLTPVVRIGAELTGDGTGDRLPDATDAPAEQAPDGRDRDVLDLLRRDLDAAGFGVVILQADTVDKLRDEFGLPPVNGNGSGSDPADDGQERRTFFVLFDVDHDGQSIPPGGGVAVTRAQFERLRRGGAIAAHFEWQDGEDT